jgi:quercetin dioxygenase-like cupin family protein
MTRRELCLLLPGLCAAGGASALGESDESLPSEAFAFNRLPVQLDGKSQIRRILTGKLATGEALEIHETTLPAGAAPHPPHHHLHSEVWLIREGTVKLTINGTDHVLGPGSVGFVHSNDEHGIGNVGAAPATYFVVAIGPGADART